MNQDSQGSKERKTRGTEREDTQRLSHWLTNSSSALTRGSPAFLQWPVKKDRREMGMNVLETENSVEMLQRLKLKCPLNRQHGGHTNDLDGGVADHSVGR